MERLVRVSLSALASVVGWGVGFGYYLLAGWLTSALGWRNDAPVIALWSAVFVATTWFIAVLPAVLAVPPTAILLRLPWAITTGAVSGFIIFALLLTAVGGTVVLSSPFYVSYAVVVGSTTSTVYSAMTAARRRSGG